MLADQANDKQQAAQWPDDRARGLVAEEGAAGVGTEMVA
jgi:hypothetical protein